MRIKLHKCSLNSRIRHGSEINGVHILGLYLLKYQIELAPVGIITVILDYLLMLRSSYSYKSSQYTYDHSKNRIQYIIVGVLHFSSLLNLPAPLQCRPFEEDPLRLSDGMNPCIRPS